MCESSNEQPDWSPSNPCSHLTGCFPAVWCCRTTPALTRIQRAAREYASSRVHVINAEQTLMQIWANVRPFRGRAASATAD